VKYLGTPAEQQTEKKDTTEPAPEPAVD
jgi:hypothetical protein